MVEFFLNFNYTQALSTYLSSLPNVLFYASYFYLYILTLLYAISLFLNNYSFDMISKIIKISSKRKTMRRMIEIKKEIIVNLKSGTLFTDLSTNFGIA